MWSPVKFCMKPFRRGHPHIYMTIFGSAWIGYWIGPITRKHLLQSKNHPIIVLLLADFRLVYKCFLKRTVAFYSLLILNNVNSLSFKPSYVWKLCYTCFRHVKFPIRETPTICLCFFPDKFVYSDQIVIRSFPLQTSLGR